MKKIISILTVVTVVTFATACNNSGSIKNQKLIVASDTASVKYQCPMKCEGDTAYTTAGQCPVCAMDLEKVK